MNLHRDPNRTSMNRAARRGVAVALVAVLAAAGCSGDDGDDATTTTADDSTEETTEDGPAEDATTTTVSDEEFGEAMATFESRLDEAGTDTCALLDITAQTPPPQPGNPEQTEQVVNLVADILRAYGASAVEAPELAAGFDQMADELVAEGEAAGFEPQFLEAQPAALSSEAAIALQDQFSELADTKCATGTDPEGTPPEESIPG